MLESEKMLGMSISHYLVEGKIGSGGMGDVYRARDTKLARQVALKLLPEEFASDSQRMGRFEREAQVLAVLNHPNIAQIYGIEEVEKRDPASQQSATKCLVLELVEGETLAERIQKGPVPLEEAIGLALQIADALEYAHEKRIVHRDLKPANIKLTPDGKVKVLDFGLAKAFEGSEVVDDQSLSLSPTLTLAATQAGMILGTAGYMSPEQARGREADKRSDIWAFGVILFEMLSGKPTFQGGTVSDVLASVLKVAVDWGALPAGLPGQVLRLLRRCLQDDPKRRIHDIADARLELQSALSEPETGVDKPVSAEPGSTRLTRLVPWGVALALGLVALVLFLARSGGDLPVRKFKIPVDQPRVNYSNRPTLSPDGHRLAYTSEGKL